MHEELVKRLREYAKEHCPLDRESGICGCIDARDAADAIEELSRQRDRAYARLCEWCGVCPEGRRNAEDCEIAALNPEPPKDEAPTGPYDLLYEEGGPDA